MSPAWSLSVSSGLLFLHPGHESYITSPGCHDVSLPFLLSHSASLFHTFSLYGLFSSVNFRFVSTLFQHSFSLVLTNRPVGFRFYPTLPITFSVEKTSQDVHQACCPCHSVGCCRGPVRTGGCRSERHRSPRPVRPARSGRYSCRTVSRCVACWCQRLRQG